MASTATEKIIKKELKEEGFDPSRIDDEIYVLLPGKSEYIRLKKGLFEKIQNGEVKL